ncbi:hypothetical protein FBUS_00539, partial [Fasciolopsis buskii]
IFHLENYGPARSRSNGSNCPGSCPQNTGILFSLMCNVFQFFGSQPQLAIPRDVNILSSDMGPYQQYFIIHMARHNMKYLPDMKEVVSRIKMRLDAVYGPLWHVFIIRGQYWAYYSHDTRTGLVFKCDDYIYLMYRSPTEG